jgi:predicted Fe-Mo cluster-binding NifX family protein
MVDTSDYTFRQEDMQMKIVVTANSAGLDVPTGPIFGRCQMFVFVDTETLEWEAVENPAISAAGGAGIQAAQFVVERGAQAVVSANVGPNAFDVFQAADVPVHLIESGGTVRQAVEAHKTGQLSAAAGASAQAHAGMRRGGGLGRHRTPVSPAAADSREKEIAELKDMAGTLRKQLADVVERLDKLEKGS